MNLKQLAKKYDLTINDLDCIYYDTFNKVKKFGESFNDVFTKFLYDRLEELDIQDRDIESLVNHYTRIMEDYSSRQPTIIKKVLENEPIQQVMDEEMQTSGFINAATEGRRKAGYKVEYSEEYDESEDKFEDL